MGHERLNEGKVPAVIGGASWRRVQRARRSALKASRVQAASGNRRPVLKEYCRPCRVKKCGFDGDTKLPSISRSVTLFGMVSWIQYLSEAFRGVDLMIEKGHSWMRQVHVVMQFRSLPLYSDDGQTHVASCHRHQPNTASLWCGHSTQQKSLPFHCLRPPGVGFCGQTSLAHLAATRKIEAIALCSALVGKSW